AKLRHLVSVRAALAAFPDRDLPKVAGVRNADRRNESAERGVCRTTDDFAYSAGEWRVIRRHCADWVAFARPEQCDSSERPVVVVAAALAGRHRGSAAANVRSS